MNIANTGKAIELTAKDNHRFECYRQPAEGSARGALIILQEIFGVTDQLKSVAAQYAVDGFDVAIPALFDRQQRNAVVAFDDVETARSLMLNADSANVLCDIEATVDSLKSKHQHVAVMGFSCGGGLAHRRSLQFLSSLFV